MVVIRAVGETLSPGPLALLRLLVGAAALGRFQLGRPWVRPTRREWAFLAVFGVLWFGGYNVLLNLAELTLDAGTASMLVNLGPILLALGAALVLGERLSRPLVIGAAVAFAGVLVIGLARGAGGPDDAIGVLAAVAAKPRRVPGPSRSTGKNGFNSTSYGVSCCWPRSCLLKASTVAGQCKELPVDGKPAC